MRTKVSRLAIAVLTLAGGIVAGSSPVHAAGPFQCRPGFYQVIAGHLKILNPLTGVYTDIGVDGDDYNAIGYNPGDNYIYGWGTGGTNINKVIRIDSDGTVTSLGSAGVAAAGYFSGDFDDNNNLWMRKNDTTLIRVNVAVNPATSTELTMTGGNFVGSDMGWISDVMYSVNNSTLYRVNLTTLQVTTATITDLNSPSGKEFPATGGYGAIFSNREDELYASNNGVGRIYKITDYTTANPKATWVTDATVTNNNDGAACKRAASPFVVPTATNDTYSTTNDSTLTVNLNTGILANDSASTPTVKTNTNPSSGTLTLNADGSFTYTPVAGFVGSTSFSYTAEDQWGRVTASATVTITVAAPATTTTVAASTTTAAATTTTVAATTTTAAATTTTTSTVVAAAPPASVAPASEPTLEATPNVGLRSALPFASVSLLVGGWFLLVIRRRLTTI